MLFHQRRRLLSFGVTVRRHRVVGRECAVSWFPNPGRRPEKVLTASSRPDLMRREALRRARRNGTFIISTSLLRQTFLFLWIDYSSLNRRTAAVDIRARWHFLSLLG